MGDHGGGASCGSELGYQSKVQDVKLNALGRESRAKRREVGESLPANVKQIKAVFQ